jgi:ketosteroid isomerase-like protein
LRRGRLHLRDCDPDAELDWSRSPGIEAGIYRGHAAGRAFWRAFFELFDRIIVSPEGMIACGEHVVVPNRARFWGRDGIEVEARSVLLGTVRDGRIVVWRLYHERTDALAAAGFAELPFAA